VRTVRYAPHVKVTRLLAQLLASHPALEIEEITIDAYSGCSDFVGTLVVRCVDGERRFGFTWDCRWRAEQEGWIDCFGLPDQMRAAQEFGWQCFQHWVPRSVGEELPESGVVEARA
jgi:hypothetical protein